jgi:hypothetical protein
MTILRLVSIFMLSANLFAGQQASPQKLSIRPAERSPLAATSDAVFAIADQRDRLVTRPADLSRQWQIFEVGGTFHKIAALAVSGNSLYVTDSEDATIFRIDLVTRTRTVVFEKGGLDEPASLAVAQDVFVADNGNGKLFRLHESKLYEVMLGAENSVRRPLSLAANGDDLFVASPDGRISELRGIGMSDPNSAPSVVPELESFPSSGSPLPWSLQKLAYRKVKEPSRIAVLKGIVYVLDSSEASVFAFSRYDRRPVMLPRGKSLDIPTGIAANDASLYVMSGRTIERWPRLIPAQVILRLSSVSEAMTLVYSYLQGHNIVPLRQIPLDKNIETTLTKNHVIPGRYPGSLTKLMCEWNPGICNKGQTGFKPLQQGQLIWAPEVYSESYVDSAPIKLDGTQSLGEIADSRIQSPELKPWTSEERLRALNEPKLIIAGAASARDTRKGDYLTPIEYVRYLVAVRAQDLGIGGELRTLQQTYEGLRIVSLEESDQRAQGKSVAVDTPVDLTMLKGEFDRMLKTVNYSLVNAPPQFPTTVGIAEKKKMFDLEHPDLRDAFLNANRSANPNLPAAVDYHIRSYREDDHATMVAGLIGARASGFQTTGLAPHAQLMGLEGNTPQIGEEIRRAHNLGAKIFNISSDYGRNIYPDALLDVIYQYTDSLFVVAAGNDQMEICGLFRVYPSCWGKQKNVLVVAATDLDGNALLPESNWNGKVVHIAAPGRGYHAQAIGQSYVPVDGTSFSTPLVTAASVLLFEQHFFDPWAIKQRLISAADPLRADLRNKVLGGKLNIRSALTNTGFGVLSRPTVVNNTSQVETRLITDMTLSVITIRKPTGSTQQIEVKRLRRVHRNPDGFLRITYVTEEGDDLVTLDGVTFPNDNEKASKFITIDATGKSDLIDLSDWDDYLGPIQVPEAQP